MSQSTAMTMPAPESPLTIDEVHLERMTLGDRSLEREVLEIFARQTTLTLERIADSGPARAAAAAHTLKGSARGIGAWRVALAAERLEEAAAGEGDEAAMLAAIAELKSQASRPARRSACAWVTARNARLTRRTATDHAITEIFRTVEAAARTRPDDRFDVLARHGLSR